MRIRNTASLPAASPCLGFEEGDLLLGEGVRLGDDGDDVDLVVQLLHELNIQGLQTVA